MARAVVGPHQGAGFILEFSNGFRVYHMGDTGIFSELELLADMYHPDLVMVPIGDRATMGPLQAAHALRVRQGTIMSRLFRARNQVAQRLEQADIRRPGENRDA